jgi:hypothetical protein
MHENLIRSGRPRRRRVSAMRRRRPFSERARAAIAPWVPLDGKQFALLMLVVLGAVALGSFMH